MCLDPVNGDLAGTGVQLVAQRVSKGLRCTCDDGGKEKKKTGTRCKLLLNKCTELSWHWPTGETLREAGGAIFRDVARPARVRACVEG